MTTVEMLLRIGAGVGLGTAIGFERQYRARMAGLRTNALVAVGSTLFVLLSANGFSDLTGSGSADPTRVAAQIVSGIGFLGAGLIFVRRDGVRGLTTAAGVWVTAAVGAAAGAGLLVLAALTTGAYLAVMLILAPVQRLLPMTARRTSTLYVRYPDKHGLLQTVINEATQRGYLIDALSADPSAGHPAAAESQEPGRPAMAAVTLRVRGRRPISELTGALSQLNLVDAVVIAADDPALDE
jgi:putative Mg2+ transporter-C (MgtC) family protein